MENFNSKQIIEWSQSIVSAKGVVSFDDVEAGFHKSLQRSVIATLVKNHVPYQKKVVSKKGGLKKETLIDSIKQATGLTEELEGLDKASFGSLKALAEFLAK